MSTTPTPGTSHPSYHHRKEASRHLHRAADKLDASIAHHERGEHHEAAERAKEAAGHVGEANSHLSEARRLHAAHESAAQP